MPEKGAGDVKPWDQMGSGRKVMSNGLWGTLEIEQEPHRNGRQE